MAFIKQVFCIFLFTFAASLFGTFLGQIQQVFATLNKKAKELEDYMEGYQSFFWDYKVTNYVKHRVQRWVQFQYSFDEAENRKREVMLDPKLPENLRTRLAESLSSGLFAQVPFMFAVKDNLRINLSGELMLRMETLYFPANAVIGRAAIYLKNSSALADKVMIIMDGRVEVRLPKRTFDGPLLHILKKGAVFGDSCLYGDFRWGGGYGVDADFIATSNTIVKSLSLEKIERLCSRKQFRPLLQVLEAASAAFLSHQNQSDIENSSPRDEPQEAIQETQNVVEVQSVGTGVFKQWALRTSLSKDFDGIMVYGLESISCRQCNQDISCSNCILKVKETRNEFKWTYITRLLYIKTKSKSKDSMGLASVFSGIGELFMHTFSVRD
mmetsp:Transcript_4906/g.10880  ORF Transcript_4906/g.10880 Transcript_4906/m.10880 type:complete len:383 (-) Transcript_4906:436-1584(-)